MIIKAATVSFSCHMLSPGIWQLHWQQRAFAQDSCINQVDSTGIWAVLGSPQSSVLSIVHLIYRCSHQACPPPFFKSKYQRHQHARAAIHFVFAKLRVLHPLHIRFLLWYIWTFKEVFGIKTKKDTESKFHKVAFHASPDTSGHQERDFVLYVGIKN